jgi:hypothetical protein
MRYFTLDNKEVNWGDYGDILLSGMTGYLDRQDGFLQLQRTGPFQPSIITSGMSELLVTDTFKEKMITNLITGLEFKPVIKAHISLVDWTNWDLQADEPEFYPESNEPEDYILRQPHSQKVTESMENVWEVIIPENGTFVNDYTFSPIDKSIDIMIADNKGYILVTEKMKNWLENNQADWLEFEEIKTTDE